MPLMTEVTLILLRRHSHGRPSEIQRITCEIHGSVITIQTIWGDMTIDLAERHPNRPHPLEVSVSGRNFKKFVQLSLNMVGEQTLSANRGIRLFVGVPPTDEIITARQRDRRSMYFVH